MNKPRKFLLFLLLLAVALCATCAPSDPENNGDGAVPSGITIDVPPGI